MEWTPIESFRDVLRSGFFLVSNGRYIKISRYRDDKFDNFDICKHCASETFFGEPTHFIDLPSLPNGYYHKR